MSYGNRELLELIQKGESSTVQFKERLPHQDSVAQEMAAFSNTKGGLLIIGVNDKTGALRGLSFEEIQSANQQLSNIASQSVFPSILITTEVVAVHGNNLIIVEIKEGISKPYKDRPGSIYMKNGSDKRIVPSNDEMARLLQNSRAMFADELSIAGTSMDDIDLGDYKGFYEKKFKKNFDKENITVQQSMQNQRLFKGNSLMPAC